MLTLFFFTATVSLLIFILTFLLAVTIRNNSIVDVVWGLGFVAIAWTTYYLTNGSLLVPILVTLWGLRLATHILLRNWGRGEDFRYAKWRTDWGKWWVVRSFFQIYLLQWFLMQLVSLPILLAVTPVPLSPLITALALLIWGLGFFFETVGDYQLTLFKKNLKNKGKLMTTGLWSLTRHPNYFGEATLWWGIALLAYFKTNSLLAFVGPLTIDFLLFYVSGIPLLEAKYKGRKDWEVYKRKTPAFFPRLKVA